MEVWEEKERSRREEQAYGELEKAGLYHETRTLKPEPETRVARASEA